ncbi:cysteine--tRNA ligase [Rhodoluna lacicola]|uniref:cysteine--tRNA ligase n=1 Tax=Rhodoluna lacicola TaxID=529884 RepID=UPI00222E275E|nr:cysteine--tRNA ligase [Rhodoluna lacicola]BDS50091.1 cysteine--tRNA ligase [Rhodoluna lacicola]
MSLSLFDSKAQAVRAFEPIVQGQVGIYLCGPTVQGAPHVGHLRSALVYDQLRRWLTVRGHNVTLVRNVTDIDDKVLDNAKQTGEQWWALAYRYELEFNRAYSALGIQAPTYEPRATAAIPEMIEIIQRLIDNGYAYVADDGSANVYFSAGKWADYGELTNQRITEMESSDDGEQRGKRESHDFALWKAHKPGEPESAAWNTPFGDGKGKGRPGWHIECSAMSTKYLGTKFDIHGGGLDLRFPHHENELAQSRAAGDEFANYWLHNGLVNVSGQKMSKSLGNSIFASDLLAAGRGIAVRYYLGSAHYRSVLDYHEGVLDEAESAVSRIETFIDRATRRLAGTKFAAEPVAAAQLLSVLPAEFVSAMDDDLAMPAALAALHETVRGGNSSLDAEDLPAAANALVAVHAMTEVLGINPQAWQAAAHSGTTGAAAKDEALETLVVSLIAERDAARAAKDFARSDAIRDQLKAAGIVLEDAADGTHWSVS